MKLFRQAFQGNYAKLVEEISVSLGLWMQLKSQNVLTAEQLRDCMSCVCHCAKYSYVDSCDILVLYDSSAIVDRSLNS